MNNSKQNLNILLVDDDLDFLDSIKTMLESTGYNVVTAESVSEAESKLNENNLDLAIVDLMLEKVDGGFTLCYKIKKQNPQIPVIMVTGVASETNLSFDAETDEERSWIKADAVLDKPVRFEELEREIARLTQPQK